jgi:hypothetical protein
MKRLSREQNKASMFELVEKYLGSGITQKQFCIAHETSLVRFQYWHKRHKEHQSEQGGFLPVQIFHGKQKTIVGNLEIQYPNGIILRLPVTSPLNLVRSFITGI